MAQNPLNSNWGSTRPILGYLLFLTYMNDIAEITNLFDMIIYADDSTLQSTLNFSTPDPKTIIND